jgi:protein tyrosine/serine phosphatase
MRRLALLVSLLACAFVWSAPASAETAAPPAKRPASWATPIPLEGVKNLNRVAPNLYRSGQPHEAGFRLLKERYGVRTVINLRDFHSDEPYVSGLGLRTSKIGMHAWHIEREDLVQALHDIRVGMRRGPTLVHCQHGADRTGVVTALYRILYQGWSKEAAIDEMEHGDFGYHDMWVNIPEFVKTEIKDEASIQKLKRDIAALK